ncbi:hypothetical protein [Phyllobacterium sp. A18/5-2]|uniref:hypothetical protein n=1 Tax=Phyllobacterium sp. A18/5-2 TaxID=2978392 RepID=UPI00290573A4|nr:hypothetical protein [Phyllobacterium sp. A18/5-2]
MIKGDLRNDLGRLADAAPKEATLVVFHTAVLSYVVAQADRDGFCAPCAIFVPLLDRK